LPSELSTAYFCVACKQIRFSWNYSKYYFPDFAIDSPLDHKATRKCLT